MLNLLRRHIIQPRRARLIQKGILDEARRGYEMNRSSFPNILVLPDRFGAGLPERAVELMLARLLYVPGEPTLDIGHANAMACHRRLVRELPPPRDLTGIDIAEPVYDTRPYYQRSVRGDITAHPFQPGEFKLIWCISTLEHFGMDNSGYTDTFMQDPGLASRALGEMLTILAAGGRMLITVPFGRHEEHGWLVNYDTVHWQRLLEPARNQASVKEWYFRHTWGAGWKQVLPAELQFTGYYDQGNSGAGGLAATVIEKL